MFSKQLWAIAMHTLCIFLLLVVTALLRTSSRKSAVKSVPASQYNSVATICDCPWGLLKTADAFQFGESNVSFQSSMARTKRPSSICTRCISHMAWVTPVFHTHTTQERLRLLLRLLPADGICRGTAGLQLPPPARGGRGPCTACVAARGRGCVSRLSGPGRRCRGCDSSAPRVHAGGQVLPDLLPAHPQRRLHHRPVPCSAPHPGNLNSKLCVHL